MPEFCDRSVRTRHRPYSTIEDRTIDITTTGRRSGQPRRIEIVFYRVGEDFYLSGIPASRQRDWLANLAAHPQFTFHLKHDVVADLPATATYWRSGGATAHPCGVCRAVRRRHEMTTDGRKPYWTSGWRGARWPKSVSTRPTDEGCPIRRSVTIPPQQRSERSDGRQPYRHRWVRPHKSRRHQLPTPASSHHHQPWHRSRRRD